MRFYLRPVGNTGVYSDAADYPEPPPSREGFEWVPGEPPADAEVYRPLDLAGRLNEMFQALDPVAQADLAPLKAAVKLELDQGRLEIARLVIGRAQIPADMETLRQQMLACFD